MLYILNSCPKSVGITFETLGMICNVWSGSINFSCGIVKRVQFDRNQPTNQSVPSTKLLWEVMFLLAVPSVALRLCTSRQCPNHFKCRQNDSLCVHNLSYCIHCMQLSKPQSAAICIANSNLAFLNCAPVRAACSGCKTGQAFLAPVWCCVPACR